MWQKITYNLFPNFEAKKDLIKIQVVRDQAFTGATAGRIVHDVQEVMGEGMHVDVEVVEEIPKEPSGKVRCAVSKVGRAI
jgi:phenylacetate-CoA ligase